jgi:hypothetical protein
MRDRNVYEQTRNIGNAQRRRSSVVEHFLGKEKVSGSIPDDGSISHRSNVSRPPSVQKMTSSIEMKISS